MIIANGTIEFKHTTGGGIDPTTGMPQRTTEEWSAPVPCQYGAAHYNALAVVTDGVHATQAEWWALIETRGVELGQCRLRDRAGNIVADKSIKRIEPLDAVEEVRLWM